MKHPEKKADQTSVAELAKYIDYSVLKPEFTEQEIIDLTKDGVRLGCATICINPGYMELCEQYAQHFAYIRTYIETCVRNGVNEFPALLRLTQNNPYSLSELFSAGS